MCSTTEKKRKKAVRHEDGKLYFTREAERKLFFLFTLLMLGLGLMVKAGLF